MLLKFACNRYTHVRHVYWNANVSKDYKEKSTLKREKKVEANEEEE